VTGHKLFSKFHIWKFPLCDQKAECHIVACFSSWPWWFTGRRYIGCGSRNYKERCSLLDAAGRTNRAREGMKL